jgi:DNA polymerase elongation subunit (family B)
LDTWCLLDAQAQGSNVNLRLFNLTTNEPKTITDTTYKPYFYLQHPLKPKDQENISIFNAETEVIKKTNLYTEQPKEITKITLPNPDLLKKAIRTFTDAWEIELEYTHSYAYDHNIIFGAQHTITQDNHITPILNLTPEAKATFNKLYAHVKNIDPMKYAQLERWFAVLNQPVPQTKPDTLGISKETTPEKIFSTFTLSKISNLPIPYTYITRGVSAWLKSIMHDYLRRNNILIPTSNELRRGLETHEVPGALTITPRSGVYFNTVVADFESLYPSCIDSYNLSYETVDCQHQECKTNQVSDTGHHVCTKRRGFLAANVGALKDLRIHWLKPQTKDATLSETQRRQAETTAKMFKLLTVSSYGVTVRIHGLACPPLAESITGYGRWALQTAWNTAEKYGLHPVYGDTDSLFLENAPKTKVDQLLKTVKEEMRLDLAIERQYSVCVLSAAKKAYFGILPDGTPDLKGLTAIKSNAPKYIQDVFKTSVKELATVNNSKEYEQAKKKITTIVENSIRDLRNRKFKTEDMIFQVKLLIDPKEKLATKMLPQPYQCAKQLIDSGKNVKEGDVVNFIKVKPFTYQGKEFTVKPANQVKNTTEINVEDYIRNLTTALNQTFKPMGIDFKDETKSETKKATEQKITAWLSGEKS